MRAIETSYAGCRFRSRLEARWAVLFDALEIRWEFEPQGFEIIDQWRWLPDFFLPDLKIWVEVKGSDSQVTDDYRNMLAHACDWNQGPAEIYDSYWNGGGLLLLSDVPRPGGCWAHTIILQHKGLVPALGVFGPQTFECLREGSSPMMAPGGRDTDAYADGLPPCTFAAVNLLDHIPECRGKTNIPAVSDAYKAARSARFEFGESGYKLRTRHHGIRPVP